jgi:hypothetical protein
VEGAHKKVCPGKRFSPAMESKVGKTTLLQKLEVTSSYAHPYNLKWIENNRLWFYDYDIETELDERVYSQTNFDFFLVCSLFNHVGLLEHIENWISYLCTPGVRRDRRFVIILVRMKSDLNLPTKDFKKIEAFCEKNNVPFVSCSSETGVNVDYLTKLIVTLDQFKKEVPNKRAD